MIELVVIEFLDAQLDVPVLMEKPSDPPESFVLIDKTGSNKRNFILSSTIAFQSYGPSKYEAALLNEKVKASVEALIVLDAVSGVHLNADYPFADVETKKYRYQAVYDINHY